MADDDLKEVPRRATCEEERCQYRRCEFTRIPGTDRCPMHRGEEIVPEVRGMYALLKRDMIIRMDELRKDPDYGNLTQELALTRIMLEKILAECSTAYDFMKVLPDFTNLTTRVQSLLVSDLKIAEKNATLMSMEQVVRIAQNLITILAEFEKDPVILSKIAHAFNALLTQPDPGSQAAAQIAIQQGSHYTPDLRDMLDAQDSDLPSNSGREG